MTSWSPLLTPIGNQSRKSNRLWPKRRPGEALQLNRKTKAIVPAQKRLEMSTVITWETMTKKWLTIKSSFWCFRLSRCSAGRLILRKSKLTRSSRVKILKSLPRSSSGTSSECRPYSPSKSSKKERIRPIRMMMRIRTATNCLLRQSQGQKCHSKCSRESQASRQTDSSVEFMVKPWPIISSDHCTSSMLTGLISLSYRMKRIQRWTFTMTAWTKPRISWSRQLRNSGMQATSRASKLPTSSWQRCLRVKTTKLSRS